MRLSTIAFALLSLGVASIAASPSDSPNSTPVARDFDRKMMVRDARKHNVNIEARDNVNVEARNTVYKNGMLTWYGGSQLDNPACGGSTPSKWDHIIAVKEGGKFKCGDVLHIHANGKMMPATVRDYCGGCSEYHIDLTQGLFQEFAALSVGEIHNAHLVPV